MINMIQLKLLSDEQLQMKTEFNLEAHSGIQKILSGGPDNVIFFAFLVINLFHRGPPSRSTEESDQRLGYSLIGKYDHI